MFCRDDTIVILEGAERQFLRAHDWEPVPKPKGAEDDPSVPRWWKDPKAEADEQQEFRQDIAVNMQKAREVW